MGISATGVLLGVRRYRTLFNQPLELRTELLQQKTRYTSSILPRSAFQSGCLLDRVSGHELMVKKETSARYGGMWFKPTGRRIFGSARQLGVHGQFQASWSYRQTLSQKEKNDLRWEARLSFLKIYSKFPLYFYSMCFGVLPGLSGSYRQL